MSKEKITDVNKLEALSEKTGRFTNLNIYRFNNRHLTTESLSFVRDAVLDACSLEADECFPLETNQEIRRENIVARATIPIFNLQDGELKHRCNWLVLEKNGMIGLVMEYTPRHKGNNIYYCFGSKEMILDFASNIQQFCPLEESLNGYRFVVNELLITEKELLGKMANMKIETGSTSQTVQVATNGESLLFPFVSETNFPDFNSRALGKEDFNEVNNLSDTSITTDRLLKGNHIGIFIKEKLTTLIGAYISEGLINFDQDHSYQSGIIGDLKTEPEFRKKGLGVFALKLILNILTDKLNVSKNRQIFIADANSNSQSIFTKFGFRSIFSLRWVNIIK